MIKELRIYWRLRPYISQLKELFKMKLRTNIVIQILMTLMQAYNQISDLLPAKWKSSAALVMGIIQAVIALLAHYSNPDGTSAVLEYIPPQKGMKMPGILLMIGLVGLATMPASAQSPDQFVGGGASYNGYTADHNFAVNGLYAKRITENTYSFTWIDVISKTIKPFTIQPMVTTGVARELFKIGNMPIYGTTGIGVAAASSIEGGTNVGYAWTAGFAPSISLGKGWHMLPNVRVIKSSLTDFQGIYGVVIGWGK